MTRQKPRHVIRFELLRSRAKQIDSDDNAWGVQPIERLLPDDRPFGLFVISEVQLRNGDRDAAIGSLEAAFNLLGQCLLMF